MIYNIRSATIHDIDAIITLIKESVYELCSEYYSKAELDSYLSTFPKKTQYEALISDRILIVAHVKETILGFTQYDPGKSKVDAIYVAPIHTGNGIGSRMLRYVEDVARSLKKNKIQTVTSVNAVGFYEKSSYLFKKEKPVICHDGTEFKAAKLSKQLDTKN